MTDIKLAVAGRVGEHVYSSTDLSHMIARAGSKRIGATTIRDYALEQNLGVTPAELGIPCSNPAMSKTYYVLDSKLQDLISGLGLALSSDDLRRAAPSWSR